MVNMNIMTEEMKKELAFTEEELKELEQFYQFPKPFYQLSKFLNFDTKIRGKKLLPTKGLVNSNADIAQTSINPGLLLKVRKTDGNVSPIATFIPEPLIDAGNPHKIRGSGFFVGVADWC